MSVGTATIHYPPLNVTSVAEMLDSSKPLVKSNLPLTKPVAPKCIDPTEAEKRRQHRNQKKSDANNGTAKIYMERLNERKFLKAQYEFDREKRLAEQTIYKKEKQDEWKNRFSNSPFLVDLVADNERIEEELYIRAEEEKRRKKLLEEKKKEVTNEIIVKALSEVPVLDQLRVEKRQKQEEERKIKALKDVKRVENVVNKKQQMLSQMEYARRERVEVAALQAKPKKSL